MSDTDGPEVSEEVRRHFPDCAAEVVALVRRNAPFRDMCLELSAAEKALVHVRTTETPHQEERVAECLGWIDRLTDEMRAALAEARIVPLHGTGRERNA